MTEVPPSAYELRVYDPPNNIPPYYVQRGVLTPSVFKWSMRYRIAVNGPNGSYVPSSFTATLDANDERADWFPRNAFIEVRRKPSGYDWRTEEVYIVRDREIGESSEAETQKLTIKAVGLSWVAQKACVWPAATDADGYSRHEGDCDAVMKAYVEEQIGVGVLPVERRCPGLVVSALTGEGLDVSEQARYADTVFDVLMRCGKKGALDFWFTFSPPNTLRFTTGDYGADRTEGTNLPLGLPYVVFSPAHTNMLDPTVQDAWWDAKTMMIVQGAGQGAEQDIFLWPPTGHRGGDGASWWDRVEGTTNAAEVEYDDETALIGVGNEALNDNAPLETLQFKVRQVPDSRYGVHYFAGDRVTARYGDVEHDYRIRAAEVWLSGEGETIEAEIKAIT